MSDFEEKRVSSSFRDPSGFVYEENSVFYRKVHASYEKDYRCLMDSGLYDDLVKKGMMIQHQEVQGHEEQPWFTTLLPEQIEFMSYPYEWSFSQLQEAALTTMEIQLLALERGMCLKDASAFNMQLHKGKVKLIDTLSFAQYIEGEPWVAYRQFCQHFLAPLAVMSYTDMQLGSLTQIHLDGIPLELAARLLPARARLSFGILTHIYMHASSQKQHMSDSGETKHTARLPKMQLLGIMQSLKKTVASLKPPKPKTVWGDYYNNTNYSQKGLDHKQEVIERWIRRLEPKKLWDTGANDAFFSRLASQKNIFTVASDFDVMAIENAYRRMKKENDHNLVPLVMNIMNPTPALGWGNEERTSFLDRASFDLTLCLALIHHLCITNNLPFSYLSKLLATKSRYLIIEFVPKGDSNADLLLSRREDIFDHYDQANFEVEFGKDFTVVEKVLVQESKRTLYLMQSRIKQ